MRLGVIAVVVSLALAGCGGSGGNGKKEYEQRAASVLPAIQGKMLKRRFALEATRAPARAQRLVALTEKDLEQAMGVLLTTKPPAEIAQEHRALIRGYRTELAEVRALEPLAHAKTTDKFRVAAAKLEGSPGSKEVAAALRAIIDHGYDLGFPTGG